VEPAVEAAEAAINELRVLFRLDACLGRRRAREVWIHALYAGRSPFGLRAVSLLYSTEQGQYFEGPAGRCIRTVLHFAPASLLVRQFRDFRSVSLFSFPPMSFLTLSPVGVRSALRIAVRLVEDIWSPSSSSQGRFRRTWLSTKEFRGRTSCKIDDHGT